MKTFFGSSFLHGITATYLIPQLSVSLSLLTPSLFRESEIDSLENVLDLQLQHGCGIFSYPKGESVFRVYHIIQS
jgi:hypothetical protein